MTLPRIPMLSLLIPALLLAGCGQTDPCAGVRDLATSPAGLTLTQVEHPAGWGHSECFQCHQAWRIHTADCNSFGDTAGLIDLAAVAEQADPQDTTSCIPCHGDNGVEGWDALLAALLADMQADTQTDPQTADREAQP